MLLLHCSTAKMPLGWNGSILTKFGPLNQDLAVKCACEVPFLRYSIWLFCTKLVIFQQFLSKKAIIVSTISPIIVYLCRVIGSAYLWMEYWISRLKFLWFWHNSHRNTCKMQKSTMAAILNSLKNFFWARFRLTSDDKARKNKYLAGEVLDAWENRNICPKTSHF